MSMSSLAAFAGRVALAAIFLMSGLAKLADPAATAAAVGSTGLPMPQLLAWAATAVEIVGSVALIAGFQTRLAAFGLAGFSILAALLFHFDFADRMQAIQFMKNVAIAGPVPGVVCRGRLARAVAFRRDGEHGGLQTRPTTPRPSTPLPPPVRR